MTKYYAVDVRDVTDAATWYEQMTALGFNLEDHWKRDNFDGVYWFFFGADKFYTNYFCEEDRRYNDMTDSYEYGDEFDEACQWFIDTEDSDADIEAFQLPTNNLYYGQL